MFFLKKAQLKGPVSALMKMVLVIVVAIVLYLIIRRIGNAFAP